jgi:cell wall assembly regulator SMI1
MDENIFTDCEKNISKKEIALIEQDLGITLPNDFKNHYLRYNGGDPRKTIWKNKDNSQLEVRDFTPLLYCKDFGDDPDFTANGRVKEEWHEKVLPPSLIAFAMDWEGNYFCIDHTNGHIFYFVRDEWNDTLSDEKNWEMNSYYLTDSIKNFVENLLLESDADNT